MACPLRYGHDASRSTFFIYLWRHTTVKQSLTEIDLTKEVD